MKVLELFAGTRSIGKAFEARGHEGYTNVRNFYGSSAYDRTQMSRLIEIVVQECKLQGIETMTPAELARLTEGWTDDKRNSAD